MSDQVEFGLTLSNRGVALGITTVKDLLAQSVTAERSGAFGSIWVGDSLAAKPRLESISLLSAVAALTERVKLGPGCRGDDHHASFHGARSGQATATIHQRDLSGVHSASSRQAGR